MRRSVVLLLVMMLFLITFPTFSYSVYNSAVYSVKTAVSPRSRERANEVDNLSEPNIGEIRVMTFNIRHTKGIDGYRNLNRIAGIIRQEGVDIVSLNEVDVNMYRTGFINQSRTLAKKVGMESYFSPTFKIAFLKYGNALLTRIPILDLKYEKIPGLYGQEPRGLVEMTVLLKGREVKIISTHLGLNPAERQNQLNYLERKIRKIEEPLIVMGDFNITPTSSIMQIFMAATGLTVHNYEPTFPANSPLYMLDYILTSDHWEAMGDILPIATDASDHLPVVGTFHLK